MQRLQNIIYESVKSTSRQPRWWILALVQAACLAVIGRLTRFELIYVSSASWLLGSLLILQPITAGLWLEIQAHHEKKIEKIDIKSYLFRLINAFAITFMAVAVVLAFFWIYKPWLFIAMLSGVLGGTAILALLNAMLYGTSFSKSYALALEAWKAKISLAAITSFVIIIGHAVSFSVVSSLRPFLEKFQEFSVLDASATIWIMFLIMAVILGFVLALLNCFLVILFLETLKPIVMPEASENRNSRSS